ncbi:hypothetical protein [Streptomyces akebiae]|uniref:Uncharacterized protein n=1 Tax=Streptomyces akebiae TaxID=2865673 RepID=A0ABX8XU81_9ACTN|nr:hypothetical protein [Streptomyces akebiae]QYX79167.1 hypothetical protein K1J60_23980 [Streptomyces akebiae]
MTDLQTVRAAQQDLAAYLATDRRVNGVGITSGTDGYAIKVNVVSAQDRPDLPTVFKGVPVEVAVVGKIKAVGSRS